MGIIGKILGYPLGWVMWFFYQICHNYAFALILFTVVSKLIMIPTTIKTQKSTVAMQALQPKLDKIKKKYGNNQEKYNEELMKLYSEENINPMGSCSSMIVPFIILYGFFDVVYRPITHIMRISSDVIQKATEILANAPIMEGNKYFASRPEMYITQAIRDPSTIGLFSDPIFDELKAKVLDFKYTFFGVDLGLQPTLHPEVWDKSAVILLIIPIMSGVFQLAMSVNSIIRQKKMQTAGAESNAAASSMNIMMLGMVAFSVWLAFKYTAAIGLYWAASALFSFIMNLIINKVITPEYVAKLVEQDKLKKKNKKKKGMMERYQQMLQEQMAAQNGGQKSAAVSSGVSDDDNEEIKLSKAQQKEYERKLINEARRRQAEKYGDEFVEDNDDD